MLGDRQQLSYIAAQAADARLNLELETEGMTLNIGPQHPATHGTLRIAKTCLDDLGPLFEYGWLLQTHAGDLMKLFP